MGKAEARKIAVYPRHTERKLLLYNAFYFMMGITILYLVGGLKAIPPYSGIIIVAGTILSFFLISYFWQFTAYRADHFILPLVSVLISTGLIFLMRLEPQYAVRQFIWLLVGLLTLILITSLLRNYDFLSEYTYIYALLGAVALILPIFFGIEQGGSRSWLDFKFFQLQTSEFVKILLILFLAAFLAENRKILTTGSLMPLGISLPSPREWGPMVAMWGVGIVLLVFQRDLGTALIYFCTFLAILYTATARLLYIFFGFVMFLLSGFVSYHIFSHVKARVDIWLNPWAYFETSGYQLIQSLFAMGSGGIFGNGLGAGSPGLIPAVHTDFIFVAICEEMGLLGGCGIIVLFIILVYRGFKIALQTKDDFSTLVAVGLTTLMALQFFIIVAGVIKLLPLTGVTLPYISYGGSSLVANFIILGLLLNISHKVGPSNEK